MIPATVLAIAKSFRLAFIAFVSAGLLSLPAKSQSVEEALAAASHATQTAFAHSFTRDIQVRALYTELLLRDLVASGSFCVDPALRGVYGVTACAGGFFGYWRTYKISIPTNFFALAAVDAMANGATVAEATAPCVGEEYLLTTLLHELHHAGGIGGTLAEHCIIYCNEKKYYDAILVDDPKYAVPSPSRPGIMAHHRSICRAVVRHCGAGGCPP